MGLFDRFKTTPKWKNDDPKIRLEAIDEIDDQNILCEIAKNDSDINVRKKAVKRVARDNILFDIALNDSNQEMRAEVIKILPGVLGNKDVIIKSVLNIPNENVVIDIAKNAKSTYARVTAVQKLVNNQSVLTDIVKTDNDYHVRQEAIKYIKDQSVIIDVAKNDSSEYVRREAVFNRNLTDKNVFRDISDNDKHWSVSAAAKERLSTMPPEKKDSKNQIDADTSEWSQEDLNAVNELKKCTNSYAGQDIIKTINNDDVLKYIIYDSSDWHYRQACIWKINDVDVIKDVARNDDDYVVRLNAVDRDVFNNKELLDIVNNDPNWNVARAATQKIDDKAMLIDIRDNYSKDMTGHRPVKETAKNRLRKLGYE